MAIRSWHKARELSKTNSSFYNGGVLPPKCSCCKKDYYDGGFRIELSNENSLIVCSECKDKYVEKNLEDFKKFISIRKIQLGK